MIGTRTHAQIRSHAQKFLIKLCKKYNIEIKSKRKENFSLGHLNFPYKRKSEKSVVPIEKISNVDLNLIKKFNFYIKKVNLENFESRETIFEIKKTLKENFVKNEDICMEKNQNSNIFSSNLIIENIAQIFIQPPEKNPNILSTKSHFSRDTLLLVCKIIESNKEVISLLARCDDNYIINSPIFECISKLKKNI